MSKHSLAVESRWQIARSRFGKLISDSLGCRMLGFAASQAWVYVVLFSNSLSEAAVKEDLLHSSFYNASLVFLVTTLILCGVVPRFFDGLQKTDAGCWCAGILAALGTFCIPLAGVSTWEATALLGAAAGTGIGSGLLLVFWGKMYGRIGGPAAAGEAAIAFTLASFVQPIVVFFPIPVRIVIAILLVLLSSGLLILTKRRCAQTDEDDRLPVSKTDFSLPADGKRLVATESSDTAGSKRLMDSAAESGRSRCAEKASEARIDSSFVRMTVSSVMLGVCTAIMQAFFNTNDPVLHDTMYTISMPIASIIAGVLLIGTLLFSRYLDLAFSYQPILLLVIAGCFLSIMFGRASLIACCLVLCSYQCFGLINWTLCADYSFAGHVSSIRIYGLGRASLSGGVLLGHILIPVVGTFSDLSFTNQVTIGFILVFVAAVACTVVFTPRHLARVIKRNWSGRDGYVSDRHRQADDNAVAGSDRRELTLDDKIAVIADEYEVSGRALEVLSLLAHGRSGTRIEQELYMSKGTVKTHTRRIYQKLDVHSKQELLDLIESVQPTEVE